MSERPLPAITPETRHFWEGARAGELRLQRCDACAHVYFPPRPFCPQCGGRSVSVVRASGRATLYSYVIHHRAAPGFTPPYSIAVVQLEEGPRMMTNIVEVAQTPEALQLDMPLEVSFQRMTDEIHLPLFRPAPGVDHEQGPATNGGRT
ncbi:MAG: Zn-ribbon domain-containing OB-fold protein [Gemmatimonadales bacterium]